MAHLKKFLDGLEGILKVLMAVLLMVMTLTIFYQVVLRYVFHHSNIWAEELTRFLFVWVSFLGSAVAIRRNRHLKVEFFLDLLKPKARSIIQICMYLGSLVFLYVLLKNGISLVSKTTHNVSTGLQIPMSIPYSAIVIGTGLIILFVFEMIGEEINNLRTIDE